ncbi:class I SAM-dependent methyltransferase [Rubripirellula reticaptiva]|uniref:Ribosomal RNA small subunit methyltransferase C n=1 Tax=Rubripirellula reticaptiva TaxID=2528013 RepID=A0A5C6FCK4_9BACT|nr:methyltransferase [Rubripirellula reticaptiva]TWU57311.1 Ribosomal RNA small subunit methyltransferase C [Rubripirellula reticaptiva]
MTDSADELSNHSQLSRLPALPSEELAIGAFPSIMDPSVKTCLVMSPGRGQAAFELERRYPGARVISWYVDSHRSSKASAMAQSQSTRVEIVCSADLPEVVVDLVVLPVLKNGEAEMNRDLLQQSYQRLRIGGHLVAAVNSPQDQWLLAQMQALFAKVHCQQTEAGWSYVAKKKSELKKVRSFAAEIEFRADGRLLKTFSRPSMFAHRSIDNAARVMMREVVIPEGANVLEMGCGNGAVALAAALRSRTGQVYAVDCNARSIQCVESAVAANEITNLTAILNHDGELDVLPCDIALLNPPYYGNFAISEHFIQTASNCLRPGGDVWVVTKQTDKYEDQNWPNLYCDSVKTVQGYDLICYRKSGN